MIPDDLRVITIRQPWANLIIRGIKDVENRVWPFPSTIELPAVIAIHAGMTSDNPDPEDPPLRRGFVLGLVTVTACVRDSDSPWAEWGKFHWVLSDPRLLSEPVPARGRQGLLPVHPATLLTIRQAITRNLA